MFVNLNTKSDYSFTEGASKIIDLVKYAKDCGAPALALTDRNNMFGAFEFSKVSKQFGIKPIIGCQMPIVFDKKENKEGYLTLLATNDIGYKNICHIMSDAQKPNKDKLNPYAMSGKVLAERNAGIIILSGGNEGLIPRMLEADMFNQAREICIFLQKYFKDRFYLQINRQSSKLTKKEFEIETQILTLSKNKEFGFVKDDGLRFNGIPVVGTSEVKYTSKDRHDAYEILRAIEEKRKVTIDGDSLVRNDNNDYHMKSQSEIEEIFSDIPVVIKNAEQVAIRCNFFVETRDPILPPFKAESGLSEDDELKRQSKDGLTKRLNFYNIAESERPAYYERLNYELEVIKNMGFPGYFLIVADFIKWAKSQDIPVGPGRGSGAGSMVAWALTITDLDPFRFGLLFERFLNPERVSMPDFDIDFCQDRREEVIKYVQKKYGVDMVSQIVTFGEIKSKTAIKDAGRVIIHEKFGGYGFGETNELTKLIPKKEDSAEPKKLQEAIDSTPELSSKINESEKLNILFQNSLKIEGMYRNSGAHAAGVIIGDRPISELAPVKWDEDTGMPLSQYNMKASESVGLVKFDFLGLKTLSVIKETIDLIKENRGINVDISKIDLEDEDVFKMLQKGQSNGVFQFESAGMQNVLRQVKPTKIEDLIAVNALYRPGPMDQIPHYAACKNGEEIPSYPNPVEKTKPFLEETYGIMVYQEQVMRVAQEVAGYSLGGADLLRRAMGKKIASEMDAQREIFIKGAVERGTSKKEANILFDTIAKFAGYGFNKSHAAAYAYIAYQTAWLKTHYAPEFFSALLSFETAKPERMALIKDDMDDFGIKMLPPDINYSYPRFRPETNGNEISIRFGLNAIKQISGSLNEFIAERNNGEFKSIKDFVERAWSLFNKSKIEKMTEAGCFDTLEKNRYKALQMLNWFAANNKNKVENQNSLFGEELDIKLPDEIENCPDWGNKIDREFNAVGFYFGGHPIDSYLPRLIKVGVRRFNSFREYMIRNEIAELPNKKICVMIENCWTRRSRANKLFLMTKVTEKGDTFDVPFFGNRQNSIEDLQTILLSAEQNRTPVVIEANLVLEDNETGLRVFGQNVFDVDEYLKDIRGDMTIVIETSNINLNKEEKEKLTQISKDKNNMTIEEYEELEHRTVFVSKVKRKMTELNEYLLNNEVENIPGSIGLEIRLLKNGNILQSKKLDKHYLFTSATENYLKSMDGVVSLYESKTIN